MEAHKRPDRIIRRHELDQFVGLRRTQIDCLIDKGEFPRPFKLSDTGRAVGWLEGEIVEWQRQRAAKRDGGEQ